MLMADTDGACLEACLEAAEGPVRPVLSLIELSGCDPYLLSKAPEVLTEDVPSVSLTTPTLLFLACLDAPLAGTYPAGWARL